MKKIIAALMLLGCGLDPAENFEGGTAPVVVYPVLMQIHPRDSGIIWLPTPDAGCRHVVVEQCHFYVDGGEECFTFDGGCI